MPERIKCPVYKRKDMMSQPFQRFAKGKLKKSTDEEME
jgi:hypothetical protein